MLNQFRGTVTPEFILHLKNSLIFNHIIHLYILVAEYAKAPEADFKAIKELKDNSDIFMSHQEYNIISAPPGSGKTTLINLLDYVLNIKNKGKVDISFVKKLKIYKSDPSILNNSPIIKLNLQKYVSTSYARFCHKIKKRFINIAKAHDIIMDKSSENLSILTQMVIYFRELLEEIREKYNKNVIVLIDNYDSPLIASYYYGYFSEMKIFMSEVFSLSFKDNPNYDNVLFCGVGFYNNFPQNNIYCARYINLHKRDESELSESNKTIFYDWIKKIIASCYAKPYNTFNMSKTFDLEICSWNLNLSLIKKDPNEFIKFLIFTGYIIVKKELENNTYKCTAHPNLSKIIYEIQIEKQKSTFLNTDNLHLNKFSFLKSPRSKKNMDLNHLSSNDLKNSLKFGSRNTQS